MSESDRFDDDLAPPEPAAGSQVSADRPRFRLVGEAGGDEESPSGTAASSESRWMDVSKYLLINGEPWLARWSKAPEGYTRVKASIPLIAALARIRSRADAALALTMVIETLYVDFHVQLPCGAIDDSEIGFLLPDSCDPEMVAAAIDRSLETQVRATDLQGGMRDRTRSRLCSF